MMWHLAIDGSSICSNLTPAGVLLSQNQLIHLIHSNFRTTISSSIIGCDTVGATALDSSGNIAFGTSTGGITAKRPGRVGDSPLIGNAPVLCTETFLCQRKYTLNN